MTALDVAELVAFLEQNDLEIYVDGGWAVDAVLGEQTRPHDDLDIAMPHAQVPQLRRLVASRGFVERYRDDSWECNFVLLTTRADVWTFTRTRWTRPAITGEACHTAANTSPVRV